MQSEILSETCQTILQKLSETCQTILQKLLRIACVVLFVPFLIIILMFFYTHRRLVESVLRIQLRDKFAGLLESTDAIWSVEDDTSLSVITILLILKKPAGSTNTVFLKNIRKFFNHLSKTVTTGPVKWFYYRYQKFGYFYWEKPSKFNPETAIRWLKCENDNCDGSCEDVHSTTFQDNLSFICNRPLCDNHKPMWEVLIGRRCPKSTSYIEKNTSSFSEDRFNTDTDELPVVIRIHHSLGDGIALLKFFNEMIVDEGVIQKDSTIMKLDKSISTVKEKNSKENQRTLPKTKITLKLKQVYNKFEEIAKNLIFTLLCIDYFFLLIFRKKDQTILHNRPLTGEKLTFFRSENDGEPQLLTKIKKIRQHTGAKVDDIILTAFAAGLSRYYLRIKKMLPDAVSIIKPTRLSMPDEKLILTNDFSFNIIKSCFVTEDREYILPVHKNFRFFERLQKTVSTNNKIRNSLEAPLILFGLKNLIGNGSTKILKHIVALYSPTMGYSNIIGPQSKLHIQNHLVSNIMFWIPNKNTTGLGLCVFTHENKLNLSVIVDKSVIGNMKLIREIIEDTVREIDSAYNSLA